MTLQQNANVRKTKSKNIVLVSYKIIYVKKKGKVSCTSTVFSDVYNYSL